MWFKDSNGNWFMANIDVMSENQELSSSWDKDSNGNWFLKKQKKTIDKVKKFSLAGSKALSLAC